MATEAEMYVGLCWRWRNIPKPTIAQVQGKVIAGGLMLVWPMDLVVCSDDATFADPVVAFGVNGHEYFTHPFEAGARLAKEMLFTGRPITAAGGLPARHGEPRRGRATELERETLALAEHIARRPSFGLTLAKQSVNNTPRRDGHVHRDPVGVRPPPRRPQPQPAALRRARRPRRAEGHPGRGLTAASTLRDRLDATQRMGRGRDRRSSSSSSRHTSTVHGTSTPIAMQRRTKPATSISPVPGGERLRRQSRL